MSAGRTALRILLPLVVLAVGIVAMGMMVKSRKKAEKTRPERQAPLVEVTALELGARRVVIRTQGTVVAARSVSLSAEVAGRVVAVGSRLVVGGHVRKGEVLLRVDPRDYRAAVQQAEAGVARAEFEVAMEQGRKDVAEREWKLLDGGGRKTGEAGRSLALREPHMKAAVASLASAESALDRARVNLERTTVRAPFDAVVVEESVEPGQVVGPQSRLCTLVGSDTYWVQVSLPIDHLAYVELPDAELPGSLASIHQRFGATAIRRDARVLRLLGGVDPAGRMARLILEVPSPLEGGAIVDGGSLPLLLDAYVDVEIDGRMLDEVYTIARSALRNGDRVFLAGPEDRLVIRDVEVAWREPDAVLVRSGLTPGERLIESHVPAPVEGMALRVIGGAPRDTSRAEAP